MFAKKCFVVGVSLVLSAFCRVAVTEVFVPVTSVYDAEPKIRNAEKPFVHASLATNLSARAEIFNKSRKLLRLNITWELPRDGLKLPESYSLYVYSLAAPAETYCRPNESDYMLVDKNALTSSMPRLLEPTVHDEMRVKAGCSYRIKLVSNPGNGTLATEINYTVPDCVGHVCDCSGFQTLPTPQLTSVVPLTTTNTLNITWTFPTTNHSAVTITHFNIALSASATNNSFHNTTVIGKKLFIADNITNNTALYHKIVKLNSTLQYGIFYCVEVLVEDSGRYCHGRKGNITFYVGKPDTSVNASTRQDDSTNSQLLITILPSVTFVLACCLAIAMLWQRCGAWICRKYRDHGHLQPLQNFQGVYKAVSHDGSGARMIRTSFPTMQERNIIYVEKEIEDAKARGDADMYEVSHGRLELGQEIGKGAFGRVFLAKAESIAGVPGFMYVAVKQLKHKAKADEVEEFLSEIAMLKQVGRHPNIVTMLGCVTIKHPYCMVMEYIPCGDLLQYLRHLRVEYERRTGSSLQFISTRTRPQPLSSLTCGPRYIDVSTSGGESDGSYVQPELPSSGRPSITETEWSLLSNDTAAAPLTPNACHRRLEYVLDPKELQNFAVQIARGMSHLERKQITHRDLAARNVLIDGNKTLKISDFGLSRSGIYVNTKRKKVPLRWLSVEAMRDNLYSSKSDVWAFAIVLWEIGTLGGFPYPTIADYDLLTFLLDGKRLEKPDNCTDELFSLMLVCWSHSADMRPSFADLVSHLDSVICRRRVYVDFDNLRPDYIFPPTEQVVVKPAEQVGGKEKEAEKGAD